jgi:protein TonB
MAYLDRPPLNQRLANLGTAGLIELGLIAALIAGLSISGEIVRPLPPIRATNIPIDPASPTPTPQPTPTTQTIEKLPIPPKDPIGLNTPRVESTPIPQPTAASWGTGNGPDTQPTAKPTPLYRPTAAIPRNNPKTWVTTDDYPSRDLREGNQGTTGFWLEVGSDGRVKDCQVTRSSGFDSLDQAACANVKRRARFKPATDGSGAKVGGTYSSSVVWRIP